MRARIRVYRQVLIEEGTRIEIKKKKKIKTRCLDITKYKTTDREA